MSGSQAASLAGPAASGSAPSLQPGPQPPTAAAPSLRRPPALAQGPPGGGLCRFSSPAPRLCGHVVVVAPAAFPASGPLVQPVCITSPGPLAMWGPHGLARGTGCVYGGVPMSRLKSPFSSSGSAPKKTTPVEVSVPWAPPWPASRRWTGSARPSPHPALWPWASPWAPDAGQANKQLSSDGENLSVPPAS